MELVGFVVCLLFGSGLAWSCWIEMIDHSASKHIYTDGNIVVNVASPVMLAILAIPCGAFLATDLLREVHPRSLESFLLSNFCTTGFSSVFVGVQVSF